MSSDGPGQEAWRQARLEQALIPFFVDPISVQGKGFRSDASIIRALGSLPPSLFGPLSLPFSFIIKTLSPACTTATIIPRSSLLKRQGTVYKTQTRESTTSRLYTTHSHAPSLTTPKHKTPPRCTDTVTQWNLGNKENLVSCHRSHT